MFKKVVRIKFLITQLLVVAAFWLNGQTTYYSKSTGNLNLVGTWGVNTDGTGASPSNFTGVGVTYIITNTNLGTIAAAWSVSGAGSSVQVGDGISPTEFLIPSSFAFNGTISVTNSSSLTIQNLTIPNITSLAVGSTVNYARAGNQNVLAATYYNLLVSGNGQKLLGNTANASISNSLIINSGNSLRLHTINTLTATITGSISGAGAILGNAASNLAIAGAGDFGTLTFTTTQSLNHLIISRLSSGTVNLGSNLTVAGSFIHTDGALSLGANALTLNGLISFPSSISNGRFVGALTSTLAIGTSTGAFSNTILFDQTNATTRSLSRFTLNRTAQTLVLGNDLQILNAFTQSNGLININGNALSIGGVLAFPAAVANGYFIGSTTSSLAITGSGAVSNFLRFDQTNAATSSLANFTLDHTAGVITFGSHLNCSSSFLHTNGVLSIASNSLNLSGAITFPASAANGSITGATTSTLTINGTGSIANALYFNQSNTNNRTLNSFLFDRSGQTLVLGNALIANNFTHSNGLINLNGALLTLNAGITFPTSITNGSFIGSTTSSLVIGTSTAQVVNPILLDQSNSSTRSLSRFSLSRAGQTFSLGTDVEVLNVFIQSNGIIDLNGTSLTASGLITFPTATTNGYFVGSPSSSLKIGGAGVITNSLKMDQTNVNTRSLNNFSIDHTAGALTLGTDLACLGNFIHTNGTIAFGTCSLSLSGAITFPAAASNGSFTGAASASLSIVGAGAIANAMYLTQTSATARTFNSFILDRASVALVLGNALTVNTFSHVNGFLNLNGNILSLNAGITFPSSASNGAFIGSPTSSLAIGINTALITNALLFDQSNASSKSLSRFAINRSAQTLVLGTDAIVLDAFVHSNCVINLNGKSLTTSGLLTFPTSTTNGYYIGSSSSSLIIGGSGAITNTLKFDQTNVGTRSLNLFQIEHTSGTLTFGNSINCVGTFSHIAGAISISTSSLTLSGPIFFPVSASNGSITGSATSSLVIDGAGSMTNALYMNQSSTTTRTFNHLTVNRSSQSLVLGNPLIANTVIHSNGNVDINGSLYTINGPVSFPVSAANGAIVGSLTSSLTIAGSGVISNALIMDQSNSNSLSLYDLLLSRSGQILSIGNALEIRNSIRPALGTIVTGGQVTLKADATRSAMVGIVGGAISGNITVETYAPGGFTGWTNLGPSGVTGLTLANWENQFFVTCNGCPNDEFSAGGYFVSVQSYNEAGSGAAAYVPLVYSSALTRGIGYWVYLGTGQVTTSVVNYSVTGPVVSGNVVLPLTVSANSGYNLIANPYAAPIDWDQVTADVANGNVSGSIYFYNPDLGQSVSYAAGVSNPSGFITNGIIPMGQGFFVQANTGTNITFRETHKSTANTNTNPLLRQNNPDSIGTVFRLSILGENLDYDETTLRFHQDATDGFDRILDARKQFQTPGYLGTAPVYSKYTTISSKMGGVDYSINSLSNASESNFVIPILAKVMANGVFTISPLDFQNFAPNTCVILHDKVLNVNHDLRTGPYNCYISDTSSTPRFELRICAEALITDVKSVAVSKTSILILQTEPSTIVVKTNFEKPTRSTVTAYNSLGQKIMDDRELEGQEESLQLDFSNYRGQIVTVKLSNSAGHSVKKFAIN